MLSVATATGGTRRRTLRQRLRELPRLVHLGDDVTAPERAPRCANSCGIVGQSEIAESSWRMRGSGRMSTAANGVSITRLATARNSGVSRMSSARSRGKLHLMTSWMRPGRGDITTMCVDRNTASGIEWVTNSTVLPVTSQSAATAGSACRARFRRARRTARPSREDRDRTTKLARSTRAAACRPTIARDICRQSRKD